MNLTLWIKDDTHGEDPEVISTGEADGTTDDTSSKSTDNTQLVLLFISLLLLVLMIVGLIILGNAFLRARVLHISLIIPSHCLHSSCLRPGVIKRFKRNGEDFTELDGSRYELTERQHHPGTSSSESDEEEGLGMISSASDGTDHYSSSAEHAVNNTFASLLMIIYH